MRTETTALSNSHDLQTLSRVAFWQYHVAKWRESGLSKIAYCRQYSLVYHQMVYWCSKAAAKSGDDAKTPSNDFVPVAVVPTLSHSSGLSVRLPNGIAIEGIDERSVSLIGKLVEQL